MVVMWGGAAIRAVAVALSLAGAAQAAGFRITATSAPGGGSDQLAQAVGSALAGDDPEARPEVINAPGSNGVVGLQRFVAETLDDGLLVASLTMMDATFVHRSPVTLDRLTPIARLCSEPFVVAVPTASPIAGLEDLKAAATSGDSGRFAWGGGPAGGIDQVAATLLAGALGIEPARLTYAPFLSSQDGAAAAAAGRVSAVFLPAGEVAGEVKAGRLRVLGSADEPSAAAPEVPTLAAGGIPLVLANWRGLLARPGLPERERAALAERLARLPESAAWREFLDRKGWRDAYLAGDPFGTFVADEQARTKAALTAAGLQKRE